MIYIDHCAVVPNVRILPVLGRYVSDARTIGEALAEARAALSPAPCGECLVARRAE